MYRGQARAKKKAMRVALQSLTLGLGKDGAHQLVVRGSLSQAAAEASMQDRAEQLVLPDGMECSREEAPGYSGQQLAGRSIPGIKGPRAKPYMHKILGKCSCGLKQVSGGPVCDIPSAMPKNELLSYGKRTLQRDYIL